MKLSLPPDCRLLPRKLDGFPYLPRIKRLLLNNNRIVRVGEVGTRSAQATQHCTAYDHTALHSIRPPNTKAFSIAEHRTA